MCNQVPLCLPNLKMSGRYIFKFEKVLLILRKVVMFFIFIKNEPFSCKNSAALNNTGEKANLHRRKRQYLKNNLRYLKNLNSILYLFFIAITVPNLNIFGAATAFQYSAEHKKTVKNNNFISMCLYVIIHKKSLFQNTFFVVTFLFLIRF